MSSSLPRAFGPYLLLARLGKGGSGSAYLARHRDELHNASIESRPLVVKVLHPRLSQHPEFLKRFRHEAEVAIRVSSPHVVRVLDAGRVGDQPYIAMDYVLGWTLSRLNAAMAEADVRMTVPVVVEIVSQTLRGLVALHSATGRDGQPLETVHRDMAPKNLMVGDDGRVWLIDLGLGKSNAQDWKTGTGTVMGSPGYMAPEQVTGSPVDQRTDLYAVGVVMHELLTGQRYIKPGKPVEMLRQAATRRYAAPSTIRRDVPASLDDIVTTAMARRCEDRFADAGAFLDALQDFLPRSAGPSAVAKLVEQLLATDRQARDRELRRLLGLSDPSGPAPEPGTEVYVRQPSVPAAAAVSHDLAPSDAAGRPPVVATKVQTRTTATQSWTPAMAPPPSRFPVLAAAIGGFGAGIAVTLVVGQALFFQPTPAPEPRTPLPSPRPVKRAPPSAPLIVPKAPAAAPESLSSPSATPDVQPDGRSNAPPPPPPVQTTERRKRADRTARPRKKAVRRRKGVTGGTEAPATVAARIDRLQARVSRALKVFPTEDPRHGALVRLLGRLSMVQASGAEAQVLPQVIAFERELASLLKDTGGTSADPR